MKEQRKERPTVRADKAHPDGGLATGKTPSHQVAAGMFSQYESLNAELAAAIIQRDKRMFFERLHNDCHEEIGRRIKLWTGGTLDTAALLDIYQNVMVSLLDRFERGVLNPEAPLREVFWLTQCRSKDACRRLTRLLPMEEVTLSLILVRHSMDELEAAELRANVQDILAHLPRRQQEVFDIFAENIKYFNKHSFFKTLAERVGERTNRSENPASIRSALRAALKTVKAQLHQRGWGSMEVKESDGNQDQAGPDPARENCVGSAGRISSDSSQ